MTLVYFVVWDGDFWPNPYTSKEQAEAKAAELRKSSPDLKNITVKPSDGKPKVVHV